MLTQHGVPLKAMSTCFIPNVVVKNDRADFARLVPGNLNNEAFAEAVEFGKKHWKCACLGKPPGPADCARCEFFAKLEAAARKSP